MMIRASGNGGFTSLLPVEFQLKNDRSDNAHMMRHARLYQGVFASGDGCRLIWCRFKDILDRPFRNDRPGPDAGLGPVVVLQGNRHRILIENRRLAVFDQGLRQWRGYRRRIAG